MYMYTTMYTTQSKRTCKRVSNWRFEVWTALYLVPFSQLHAELAHFVGVARERTIQALRGAPATTTNLGEGGGGANQKGLT